MMDYDEWGCRYEFKRERSLIEKGTGNEDLINDLVPFIFENL